MCIFSPGEFGKLGVGKNMWFNSIDSNDGLELFGWILEYKTLMEVLLCQFLMEPCKWEFSWNLDYKNLDGFLATRNCMDLGS